MPDRRAEKKSETLQIRVPHSLKMRLARASDAEGRPASDIVREAIEGYLDGRMRAPDLIRKGWPMIVRNPAKAAASVAALAFLSLSVAVAPSTAQEDAFAVLDATGAGRITAEELPGGTAPIPPLPPEAGDDAPAPPAPPSLLSLLDKDGDGAVSRAEFPKDATAVRVEENGETRQELAFEVDGRKVKNVSVYRVDGERPTEATREIRIDRRWDTETETVMGSGDLKARILAGLDASGAPLSDAERQAVADAIARELAR